MLLSRAYDDFSTAVAPQGRNHVIFWPFYIQQKPRESVKFFNPKSVNSSWHQVERAMGKNSSHYIKHLYKHCETTSIQLHSAYYVFFFQRSLSFEVNSFCFFCPRSTNPNAYIKKTPVQSDSFDEICNHLKLASSICLEKNSSNYGSVILSRSIFLSFHDFFVVLFANVE